ncbi:MAG: aldo/keto reductase [Isosphaeraceae bacterium]|nr:aldo/keto reductase [Isosphaeraceae bacterium]
MDPSRLPPPDESGMTRRTFLHAGTTALALSGVGTLARPAWAQADDRAAGADVEWRNKQSDMAYRRLGRTKLMISEVISGGDPITLENYRHLEAAIERGLNYLDMAPAYNRGDTERAYGKLLAGSSAKRQKVFLTTKISGFNQLRERMYREIFDGLPGEKQEAIRQRARALREERGVEKPGYFLAYFPGQRQAFDSAYLRVAMMPDYAHRVEGSRRLREFIVETLEGSLKRVGTDYFDIVMCPHGANTPEDLSPEIAEVFQQLKQQGKVRFLGVTSHNDPAGVLRAATAAGHYDVVMMAYNVINGGYLEEPIRQAAAKDVGVIAMKVAMAVATHHKSLQPVPEWRIQKVERIVPGDWKPPQKAYLWALQNPHIAAVISNLWDETYVRENLAVAGKKVELQPA